MIKEREYDLKHIGTEDNVADLFTKPLGRLKFQRFADMLLSEGKKEDRDV
jgi:hypothetical protein